MANARGKTIDKTHLSIDNAEERGFIHRDYIAHCHRWSHVVKYLLQKHRYKGATILDIGCGKEVPLAKLLYSNKMTAIDAYIGVDVNKLDPDFNFGSMADNIQLCGKQDICNLKLSRSNNPDSPEPFCEFPGEYAFNRPTVITCFEVLEHVEPEHTRRILQKIREVLAPGGRAFISTPCFNGKAAANHVNEITYEALGTLIQNLGFGIEGVYGTFASQTDIEPAIARASMGGTSHDLDFAKVYELLKEYYDSNVLSTIFAPLFPEHSRNALWVLTRDPEEHQDLRAFGPWSEIREPWTSSDKWRELKGEA